MRRGKEVNSLDLTFNNIIKNLNQFNQMINITGLHPKLNLDSDSTLSLLNNITCYQNTVFQYVQHFQLLNRHYQQVSLQLKSLLQKIIIPEQQEKLTSFEKDNRSAISHEDEQFLSAVKVPFYFGEVIQLFSNIQYEVQNYTLRNEENTSKLKQFLNTLFKDVLVGEMDFKEAFKSEQINRNQLIDTAKYVQKLYSQLNAQIFAFKQVSSDAKLAYNISEKQKRYSLCQNSYQELVIEIGRLYQFADDLNKIRQSSILKFQKLEKTLFCVIKSVSSQLLQFCQDYTEGFDQANRLILTFFTEKQFTLQKNELKSIIFDINIYIKSKGKKPNLTLLPKIQRIIHEREQINASMYNFFNEYIKTLQKNFHKNLKEILNHYEELKKKIKKIFGKQFLSFNKALISIIEISIKNSDGLNKKINYKLKIIEKLILEQQKQMKQFSLHYFELQRSSKSDFIGSEVQNSQKEYFPELSSSQYHERAESNLTASYVQNHQFSFKNKDYAEALKKICSKTQGFYNSIINDLKEYFQSNYQFFEETKNKYFKEGLFEEYYASFKKQYKLSLQKELRHIKNTEKGEIWLNQKLQVVIDKQKMDQFKLLPNPLVKASEQKRKSPNRISQPVNSSHNQVECKQVRRYSPTNKVQTAKQSKQYKELISKVGAIQNEILLGTFGCGLADKIILAGRLFVTTDRCCFLSKFNTSNIFFGETIIEIPKQDLINVHKRSNVIFNNSISLHTRHGEIFLTSFFSRNQAFDLIWKAYRFQNQQKQLILQESKSFENGFPEVFSGYKSLKCINLQFIQKLTENQKKQRYQQLLKGLQQFDYETIEEYEFKGINTFQFFAVFFSGESYFLEGKKYSCFLTYFKESMGNKEIEIQKEWKQLEQQKKQQNSKLPLKFIRVIKSMVPLPNTGVPFMPKLVKSIETHYLSFFDKSKFIIEITVVSKDAPYSDCFDVRLKITVEDCVDQQRIKVKIEAKINFIKNTILKSIISSKAKAETITYYAKFHKKVEAQIHQLLKSKAIKFSEIKAVEEQKGQDQTQIQIQSHSRRGNDKQNPQKWMGVLKWIFLASLILNIFLIWKLQ